MSSPTEKGGFMPKQYKSYLPPEGRYVIVDNERKFIPKEKICPR